MLFPILYFLVNYSKMSFWVFFRRYQFLGGHYGENRWIALVAAKTVKNHLRCANVLYLHTNDLFPPLTDSYSYQNGHQSNSPFLCLFQCKINAKKRRSDFKIWPPFFKSALCPSGRALIPLPEIWRRDDRFWVRHFTFFPHRGPKRSSSV